MTAVKSWWDESLGNISAHGFDTGGADACEIAPAPAITAYATGQSFHFFAANANTGAATLDVNGLGAKAIQRDGVALSSGDIGAGDLVSVVYDGTQFQLPPMSSTGTLTIDTVNDRIGVGEASPLAIFHVTKTGGATSSVNTGTLALFEHSGSAYVSIISGTSNSAELWFGDSDAQIRGRLLYNNTADALDIYTAGSQQVSVDASGNLDLANGSLELGGNAALPVDQLTTLGSNSFDQTVDSLLLWDNSASAHKQVKLQDLGLTVVSEASAQTFALGDANTLQSSTSATAVTWTVPPNSSVAFEIGTVIQVFQSGAGQVTFAPGSGVTIRSPNGTKTGQLYGVACLAKIAADEWVIYGDVTT